jgi:hypothetical protein
MGCEGTRTFPALSAVHVLWWKIGGTTKARGGADGARCAGIDLDRAPIVQKRSHTLNAHGVITGKFANVNSMKKQCCQHRRSGGLLVLAVVILGAGTPVKAQLNEDKVERDATGVYSGSSGGGRWSMNFADPGMTDPDPGIIPTQTGRVRVPVKDGKLTTTLSDPDLQGNGKASCSGTEQRSDVKRGGKLIMVKAVAGKVSFDDGPTQAPWTGGTIVGTLTDKGAKWAALTKGSARQVNSTATQPNIQTVSNNVFKGKG